MSTDPPTSDVQIPSRGQQLWRAVRAHQPSKSSWPSALRRGFLVAVLVAVGALTGEFVTASLIGMGALNMGLVDEAVPRKTLTRTLLSVAILGGFIAFVASALAGTWWTVALLAALAYLSGAIGSLGLIAFNTTFMTLVMAVLFTNDPGDVDNSLRLGILVLIGGLLQAASSIIAWRYDRDASLRRKLSLSFDALTDLAEVGGDVQDSQERRNDQHSQAFIRMNAADKELAAERAIADAGLRPARADLFNAVVAELNWTRLCLTTWLTSGHPTPARREQVQAALVDAAWHLHHHARTVVPAATSATPATPTGSPDPAWTTLVDQLAKLHQATHELRAQGLTSASKQEDDAATTMPPAAQRIQTASRASPGADAESSNSLSRIGRLLLPSSPTFRQAVRLTLAVIIAQSIAVGFDLERGYWLPLTVVMVVKPDFTTTLIRGSLRILGTIAAVLLIGFLLEATGNPQWLMVILLAVFAPLTMRWISANYAFGSFAIGTSVLVLIEAGSPEGATIILRLENTLMGVAIAIFAYLIFPSWSGNRLLPALTTMIETQRAWTAQVLTGLLNGQSDAQASRSAGRNSRDALLAAQPLVDQANLEPHRAACDPNAAFSLIYACHRAAVATLALEVVTRQPLALRDHERVHQTVNRIDDDLTSASELMSQTVGEPITYRRPGAIAPLPTVTSQAPVEPAPLARIDAAELTDTAAQNAIDALEKLVTAASTTVVAAGRIQSGG